MSDNFLFCEDKITRIDE